MANLPFTKVEGLGNDFVVVDLRRAAEARRRRRLIENPAVVRAVCNRHFGVGADGVLAILPGVDGDARMRVLNADGSEAEMCGNGIRCVAKVLYDADATMRRPVLHIEHRRRLARVRDRRNGMARRGRSRSDGPPAPDARRDSDAARWRRSRGARADQRARPALQVTAVSMGNPHAVIFVDDPDADLRALAEEFGPGIEIDTLFPRRTNVEFARIRGGAKRASADLGAAGAPDIDLVVWERGSASRSPAAPAPAPPSPPRASRNGCTPASRQRCIARRHAAHHGRADLDGVRSAAPR